MISNANKFLVKIMKEKEMCIFFSKKQRAGFKFQLGSCILEGVLVMKLLTFAFKV